MNMFPIRLNSEIRFQCFDCKKRFWIDGEQKISDTKCPYCDSHNHYPVYSELPSSSNFKPMKKKKKKILPKKDHWIYYRRKSDSYIG